MNPNREAIRAQLCQLYAMEMAAREPGDARVHLIGQRASGPTHTARAQNLRVADGLV